MSLFFSARPLNARENKIAALKSMNAAELADVGLKPGDVSRVVREIRSGR